MKANRVSAGMVALGGVAGAGCMLWIPIVGWIMVPVFLLIAIGAAAMALLPSGKVAFLCTECGQWFTKKKTEIPT